MIQNPYIKDFLNFLFRLQTTAPSRHRAASATGIQVWKQGECGRTAVKSMVTWKVT